MQKPNIPLFRSRFITLVFLWALVVLEINIGIILVSRFNPGTYENARAAESYIYESAKAAEAHTYETAQEAETHAYENAQAAGTHAYENVQTAEKQTYENIKAAENQSVQEVSELSPENYEGIKDIKVYSGGPSANIGENNTSSVPFGSQNGVNPVPSGSENTVTTVPFNSENTITVVSFSSENTPTPVLSGNENATTPVLSGNENTANTVISSSENTEAVAPRDESTKTIDFSHKNMVDNEKSVSDTFGKDKNITDIKKADSVSDENGTDPIPALTITFDDGYDSKAVAKTLDILKKYNIKSTFFIVGEALKRNSELWRRAVQEGHQVCNHTQEHKSLSKLSLEDAKKQILDWEKTAASVLGEDYVRDMKEGFPYFRLPGGNGSQDEKLLAMINDLGYTVAGWSVETCYAVLRHYDLKKADINVISEDVVRHVTRSAENGSIILLHFTPYDTTRLEEIITGILGKGFEIVPLGEILDVQ